VTDAFHDAQTDPPASGPLPLSRNEDPRHRGVAIPWEKESGSRGTEGIADRYRAASESLPDNVYMQACRNQVCT
jgi:hypothetical protein